MQPWYRVRRTTVTRAASARKTAMRLAAPAVLLVAFVTLLALILYIGLGFAVARARGRHGITPPAMVGPPEFERANRIYANTLEQLVPFLFGLWLCAIYFQPLFAAVVGFIWVIARFIYALGYRADPAKRLPGFIVALIATCVLILTALFGVIQTYLLLP